MPDPVTTTAAVSKWASPVIASGVQALGSLLGGLGQGQASREQLRLQKQLAAMQARQNWEQMGMGDRQFGQQANLNRSQYLDQRAVGAADLQKRMAGLPMADRAMYMMTQRAGQVPGAFQARDYTRGGMPGAGQATGGYAPVLDAQRASAAQYTAGAGGLDPRALQAAQERLQSMAGVPAEYMAQSAGAMRLGSAADQLREQMAMTANDKKRQGIAGKVQELQKRAAEERLARLVGMGG